MTSLYDEIQKILGNKKMQKVSLERLRPPMAPIASEKSGTDIERESYEALGSSPDDSKLAIDFNAIANASEFRRFIYWIRTGQVFRGSNEKLTIELNKTQEELDIVKLMKKQQKPIFMGVMNEYKNKVAKLKEKRDQDE